MDWRTVTFDWNRARAFLVTAEEGSFSAASRALGIAQPTVGRQVAALEEELAVTLFERIGSRLELTETGLDLLEHVRAMYEAAAQVSLVAAGQSQVLNGVVRLAASEAVAAFVLPTAIRRIRQEHPGIELEIVASNAPSDLQRREADIAVRNFRPTQPDLVAQKLREHHARPYASVDYVERNGPIVGVEDLARLEILGFDRTPLMLDGMNAMGWPVTARNLPVITDNHLVQWQLARAGVGICIMMEMVGDADPGMRRVLADLPCIRVPMWLTSHRELRTSRRIRVVYDLLVAELGGA